MRESVLREFFEDKTSAAELARDVAGSIRRTGKGMSVVSIEDMDNEFQVTAAMAVRLCDAVLQGELEPQALHAIGFALMASDTFCWHENDVLGNVIADWSCPEVNYPLTVSSVRRFREWLTRTAPYPPKPSMTTGGSIISVTKKKPLRR